jgi:hypothetical protein
MPFDAFLWVSRSYVLTYPLSNKETTIIVNLCGREYEKLILKKFPLDKK